MFWKGKKDSDWCPSCVSWAAGIFKPLQMIAFLGAGFAERRPYQKIVAGKLVGRDSVEPFALGIASPARTRQPARTKKRRAARSFHKVRCHLRGSGCWRGRNRSCDIAT